MSMYSKLAIITPGLLLYRATPIQRKKKKMDDDSETKIKEYIKHVAGFIVYRRCMCYNKYLQI